MGSFMVCISQPIGSSNQEELNVLVMWHVWGRGKVHIGFWWRKLRRGVDLEYYT